jgi:hypothetical protein
VNIDNLYPGAALCVAANCVNGEHRPLKYIEEENEHLWQWLCRFSGTGCFMGLSGLCSYNYICYIAMPFALVSSVTLLSQQLFYDNPADEY